MILIRDEWLDLSVETPPGSVHQQRAAINNSAGKRERRQGHVSQWANTHTHMEKIAHGVWYLSPDLLLIHSRSSKTQSSDNQIPNTSDFVLFPFCCGIAHSSASSTYVEGNQPTCGWTEQKEWVITEDLRHFIAWITLRNGLPHGMHTGLSNNIQLDCDGDDLLWSKPNEVGKKRKREEWLLLNIDGHVFFGCFRCKFKKEKQPIRM